MTVLLVAFALVAGLALGAALALALRRRREPPRRSVRRILLPFTGTAISRRALDSALRLARAEDATLVPAYLATVSLKLPLDAPLPAECERAMPLLEALEQRATRAGVQVDSRIERGRTARDALRRLLAAEDFERIVVPASSGGEAGFSSEDVEWILDRFPNEVVVFRSGPVEEDQAVLFGADIPARA